MNDLSIYLIFIEKEKFSVLSPITPIHKKRGFIRFGRCYMISIVKYNIIRQRDLAKKEI
jgi:hypothetical protein